MNTRKQAIAVAAVVLGVLSSTYAQADDSLYSSGKLLLTNGVTNIEGASGGGLSPWALIGGYGTKGQVGATANYTHVNLSDYSLETYGALIGIDNRVEFSIAHQTFDTERPGIAVRGIVGLPQTGQYNLNQNIYGVKVRVYGDAVLDQDSWIPQIAVGALYKQSDSGYGQLSSLAEAVGAKSNNGTDFYVAGTKLFLNQSVLANVTIRATKANQFGLLGFGSSQDSGYRTEFEASLGYLLRKDLVVGAEIRTKPNNLNGTPVVHASGDLRETNAYDAFIAYALSKKATATLAYVDVGKIVPVASGDRDQRGTYLSIQLGF